MFSNLYLNRIVEQYKPPEPGTSESQWYHGTLNRKEAQNSLNTHAKYIRDKRKSDDMGQADNNCSFEDSDDVRVINLREICYFHSIFSLLRLIENWSFLFNRKYLGCFWCVFLNVKIVWC